MTRARAGLAAALLVAATSSGCAAGGVGGGVAGAVGVGTLVGSLKGGSVPAAFAPWVTKAGGLCPQVTAPLLAAQLQAESGFNAKAQSPAGAQGAAQFMPATWSEWGQDDDGNGSASPLDIGDAVMAQGRHMCALAKDMAGLLETGAVKGDLTSLILAAYNAGPGAVQAAGGVPAFAETQGYISKITSAAINVFGGQWASSGGGDGTLASAIAILKTKLGTPYVWGGGTPQGPSGVDSTGAGPGWDCSSYVQYGIYQATRGKVTIPRTTYTQVDGLARYAVSARATKDLKAGDLLYNGTPPHHVVMYIGNGQVIHEPKSGDVAKISPLWFTPSTVIRLPLTQMMQEAA